MKHVTILVPDCNINLNSVGGAYEILKRANEYWQRMGNPSRIEIRIAGFVSESKVDDNYFTIHPLDLRKVKKTDLLIVPSIFEDYHEAIKKNKELIDWMLQQHRNGAEIASMCSGAFLLAATGLLDGKTCSTHWNAVAKFRDKYGNMFHKRKYFKKVKMILAKSTRSKVHFTPYHFLFYGIALFGNGNR